MINKRFKEIHTTIPKKYWEYATNKKLKWSELLTKAIEQEMNTDPNIIKEKINNNYRERDALKKQLEQAEQRQQENKTKLQDLHKGLIPVD